jgi:predicted transcriptional regulator
MQQLLVRDVMRVRHSHVVPETLSIREIATRFIISDCDLMATVDADGKLSGTVCESSVVRALMAGPDAAATIQSIICRHADSIQCDAHLTQTVPLFRACARTALPVTDSDRHVKGLLLRRDVLGKLLNPSSTQAGDSVEDYSESITQASGHGLKGPVRSIGNQRDIASGSQSRVDQAHRGVRSAMPENRCDEGPHFLQADEARRLLWTAEDRL